jgi:hypothetical protein
MILEVSKGDYLKIIAALTQYGSSRPNPTQKDIVLLIKDLHDQAQNQ